MKTTKVIAVFAAVAGLALSSCQQQQDPPPPPPAPPVPSVTIGK